MNSQELWDPEATGIPKLGSPRRWLISLAPDPPESQPSLGPDETRVDCGVGKIWRCRQEKEAFADFMLVSQALAMLH